MSRRFTAASSERIICGAAGANGLNYQTGTMAAVIWRSVDTGTFETFMTTNDGVGASAQFHIYTADQLALYDGFNTRVASTAPVGEHLLVGVTKVAGTVAPRFHRYQFAANTWVHANGASTSVNGAVSTTLSIGSLSAAGAEFLSSEVWALGLWQLRPMTDSEFERLARGRWLDQSPDWYTEFTNGEGREVGDMMTTFGRKPARQTSRTGTTRGVQRPPPGFQFAIQRRRR